MMKLVLSATTARVNFAPIMLQGPLEEDFRQCSEWGYDAIELHIGNPNDIDWDTLVELTVRYSLPVTAIGTGAAARVEGLTFTDPDGEVRARSVERIEDHLKLAKRLGCSIIIGSMNGTIKGDPDRKCYHLDCMKQCCDLAAKDHLAILIEPLNRYENDWLNTFEDTLEIITKTGYPHLKYLADTFHMNIEEADMCKTLRNARQHLGYVHLVDSNRCAPGYGHLLFGDILKTLVDVDFDGWLSFECLPSPTTEIASKASFEYVKDILASCNVAD